MLKNPLFWRQHLGFVAMSARQIPGSPPHVAKMGVGHDDAGVDRESFGLEIVREHDGEREIALDDCDARVGRVPTSNCWWPLTA
jgi:hypothetical protein